MAGITANGFVKKDFNEILDDMITEAQNIYGEDIDLRDETFLKQMLVNQALREAERWDVLEDIYNNFSVTQATGKSLDYAVKFLGLRRKKATKSTVTVTFTGDDNTVINNGFIVQTINETKFQTTVSGTITGGSVDIICEALIAGADGNVLAGTITETESPLVGLTSITNSLDATGGLEEESDESLYIRFLESLALGGGSTANAIRAAILSLENVTDAIVFENDTDAIVDGTPPHSFTPYVLGGADLTIQTEIFDVKSAGIKSNGTLTNTFTDDNGNEITIGINRPTDVDIWFDVTVTRGGDYPIDGDDQVETAVLEYVQSLLMGDDVIVFALSNYIANNVGGITNLFIETSTDGITYNNSDITIFADLVNGVEKAVTDVAKIAVI